MKVQIVISGQINGNYKLLSELNNGNYREGMFNSKIIYYDTKKEAKKAIREAYKSLCIAEPNMRGNLGGISRSKRNDSLYYDASKAIIVKLDR